MHSLKRTYVAPIQHIKMAYVRCIQKRHMMNVLFAMITYMSRKHWLVVTHFVGIVYTSGKGTHVLCVAPSCFMSPINEMRYWTMQSILLGFWMIK